MSLTTESLALTGQHRSHLRKSWLKLIVYYKVQLFPYYAQHNIIPYAQLHGPIILKHEAHSMLDISKWRWNIGGSLKLW